MFLNAFLEFELQDFGLSKSLKDPRDFLGLRMEHGVLRRKMNCDMAKAFLLKKIYFIKSRVGILEASNHSFDDQIRVCIPFI